jgi:hypothetical protein
MEPTSINKLLDFNNQMLSAESSLTISIVFINILLSGILGSAIAIIYFKYFQGVLFQKSFAFSLILITMITTLVIMVISGNLILSLGMVGALSIVRFRSAIKDPLDVVYIFWSVGTGIAIGVSQYMIAFSGFAAIIIVISLINKMNLTKSPKLIVISCDIKHKELVDQKVKMIGNRSVERSSQLSNGKCEIVYETMSNIDLVEITKELEKIIDEIEVRIINYYGNS